MYLDLDLDRVRANVAAATTEDLLDRATVYREGMEPQALAIIDAELRRRGVGIDEIDAHAAERWQTALTRPDGSAVRCAHCDRPAVIRVWAWHHLWGRWPVFPRRFALCAEHGRPWLDADAG